MVEEAILDCGLNAFKAPVAAFLVLPTETCYRGFSSINLGSQTLAAQCDRQTKSLIGDGNSEGMFFSGEDLTLNTHFLEETESVSLCKKMFF